MDDMILDGARGDRRKGSFKRVLLYGKPYLGWFFMCAVCVLVAIASELSKPYILALIIDEFLIGGAETVWVFNVTTMGIFYLIITVLSSVMTAIEMNIINYIAQNVLCALRRSVFRHIQLMPLKLLDRYSAGRLITRATNDVEAINELVSGVLMQIMRDVFTLIGLIYIMLTLHWQMALVSFACIPLIVILTFVIRGHLRRNFQRMKALIGQINGFIAENISGMRIVQIFNRQQYKLDELNVLNASYFKTTMTQNIFQSFMRPMAEIGRASCRERV